MRFFTTEGPVNCSDHYCLPPLARINLEEIRGLIAQKKYFLLHAPRQTGKTSCLLALADLLNRICVRCSLRPLSKDQTVGYIDRRLKAVGGRCELESQPGHGTVVRFVLPLEPPAKHT